MAQRPERDLPSPYIWERHTFAGKRWPNNRVARSFLMLAPWLTLMALGVLLWAIGQATLVQPGRVVDLAEASLSDGLPARLPTAVVRRVASPSRGEVTVLLLDEGSYSSDNASELEALGRARPGEAVNLVVDAAVTYRETLDWVGRLQACGVRRVNLVATPKEPDGAAAEH